MGQSAVPKRLDEVRRRQHKTVFVDEEGVPVKKIVIPLLRGNFVKWVNNRANRCRRTRSRWFLGRHGRPGPKRETHGNDEPSPGRLAVILDRNARWHGKLRPLLLWW